MEIRYKLLSKKNSNEYGEILLTKNILNRLTKKLIFFR